MSSTLETGIHQSLNEFSAARGLNGVFTRNAESYFLAYASRLSTRAASEDRPIIVGLNGAQGSGKSTLSELLAELLPEFFDVDCHVLSLDDFYLTRAQRRKLGGAIHPLLAIRGVPGTHDCSRLKETLEACSEVSGADIALPIFDKLKDDRTRKVRTIRIGAKPTIILLEGWCVGIPPQSNLELAVPAGSFEFSNDNVGTWRNYVNEQLATTYAELFTNLDYLSMLKPPCFEAVLDWRLEQEVRLISKQRAATGDDSIKGMNVKQVAEFVENFRRLTCHAMTVMPAIANETWELQADRLILAEVKRA